MKATGRIVWHIITHLWQTRPAATSELSRRSNEPNFSRGCVPEAWRYTQSRLLHAMPKARQGIRHTQSFHLFPPPPRTIENRAQAPSRLRSGHVSVGISIDNSHSPKGALSRRLGAWRPRQRCRVILFVLLFFATFAVVFGSVAQLAEHVLL